MVGAHDNSPFKIFNILKRVISLVGILTSAMTMNYIGSDLCMTPMFTSPINNNKRHTTHIYGAIYMNIIFH